MTLLDGHVRQHALRRPDDEAVTDGLERFSYSVLERAVSHVAALLADSGVEPGDRVLVCMKRSTWALAAMLGVLRARAAYVPLEVRTPAARREEILTDCGPAAVLCDRGNAQALTADAVIRGLSAPVLVVDGSWLASREGSSAALTARPPISPDDLACVLYTSGSTGRAKGVMLSHRNIDEYARWAVERVGIESQDRVLSTAPFYFDMSLFDIFCALRAGACLCIATERVLLFPKKLLQFAESERATVWKGVSSLLTYLSRTGALGPDRIPTMRAVLFGGEELPTKYLRAWMATFPHKVFYNFFGPTEGTGASLYHHVPRAPEGVSEKVPIGIPRENTVVYLLAPDGSQVAAGEVGEIAVSGVCVTHGYLNDPERTARVFKEDPWRPGERMYLTGDLARRRDDGCYVFVGRKDDQVKLMGYRLELGDVEHALTAIDGVVEAGVLLATSAKAGVDELVAYVVLEGETSAARLRAALKGRLPFYMLPRHIHSIERLPRSVRGKLDRPALRVHHQAQRGGR